MQRSQTSTRRPSAVPPGLRPILGETEAALRRIYGDRFRGLVLFGSQARGKAGPRRYSQTVAELSLRHDTVISLVPMAVEEFRSGRTPFLLNVRREGIPL